jgi:hypothetical protein
MNKLETIDVADLDNINGGRGRAIWEGAKAAGSWAWRNVIAPAGGGAIYDWATSGGGQRQQPQQPASGGGGGGGGGGGQ